MVAIIEHPEYTDRIRQWETVEDAASPTGVKDAGKKYLPFVGDETNTEDQEAYKRYRDRAQYYGFTTETVRGMTGLAFDEGTDLEDVDAAVEYIESDLDGNGVGIEQAAKASTTETVKTGRAGLLVDYPEAPFGVTRAQADAMRLRASVLGYRATQIKNWQTRKYGAVNLLSLVSLSETVDVIDEKDDLTVTQVTQERRLLLVDEIDENGEPTGQRFYRVEVYRDSDDADNSAPVEVYEPRNAAGVNFDYIPFFFIGAVNNDARVDDSPTFPIADLNIGHYRNSADYENSIFLLQPQPWASGLTQAWVDQNARGFRLGSGVLLPLPQGGQFGIEQPEPNTIAFEAMGYKQKAMVALGAKMITADISFNTAREAMLSNGPSSSKLQTIVDNVERAYNDAMVSLAEFMGTQAPVFTINADLSKLAGDAQLAAVVVNSWTSGLIAKEDAREYMRGQGLITRTDEEIDDDLETNPDNFDLDAGNVSDDG